jgi:hypothetical protein
LHLIARLASLMVAALKAPLPDAAQLAAFAAVLGDAGDGCDAAAGISACGPLDAAEHDEVDRQSETEASALVAAATLQAATTPPAQLQEGSRPAL